MRNYDKMTIEEMCEPLSAKVLPRSAHFTHMGHEIEPDLMATLQLKEQNRRNGTKLSKRNTKNPKLGGATRQPGGM